ncbi:hypothetical protein MKX03_018813 [Papaver bracteatum]|nr:hypothetical protein MKX03_018813 [Papaver bracteatum]
MGHHQRQQQQNHPSMDGLVNLLSKSNNDLTTVYNKLEREFQQTYPDNANPLKLVTRIKKIQDDLSSLKDQCRELLSAKQDLIDKARMSLVSNRSLVQQMQVSSGILPTNDSDDPAYTNLNQIIAEWTAQLSSKTGDDMLESDSDDINKLLFSALVHPN